MFINMKKLVGIFLIVALILAMTACQTEGMNTTTTTTAEATTATEKVAAETTETAVIDPIAGKSIGFVNAGPDDYYAQFGDAFKAIAEQYGMDVIEVNSNYSPEKELTNVQDMIAKGVDAIAVITAGATGSANTIAAANEAGVPIFFIAGKPEEKSGTELTGFVGNHYVMIGYMAGQWVADHYPDATCQIMPGFLVQGTAESEIVGFQMALKEAGMSEADVLRSGEWQRTVAIPIAEDLVSSGKKFDVIYAGNEEMAFGIQQVFEELGVKDKIIVTGNGKEEGWEYLKDGRIAATVPDAPSLNADLCVQQIVNYFNGQEFIQYLQIMPPFVLTKDNIDQAIPWKVSDYLQKRNANDIKYQLADYEKDYLAKKDRFEEFDAKLAEYMANN
jgi:ribose transport system substrate-binding protein